MRPRYLLAAGVAVVAIVGGAYLLTGLLWAIAALAWVIAFGVGVGLCPGLTVATGPDGGIAMLGSLQWITAQVAAGAGVLRPGAGNDLQYQAADRDGDEWTISLSEHDDPRAWQESPHVVAVDEQTGEATIRAHGREMTVGFRPLLVMGRPDPGLVREAAPDCVPGVPDDVAAAAQDGRVPLDQERGGVPLWAQRETIAAVNGDSTATDGGHKRRVVDVTQLLQELDKMGNLDPQLNAEQYGIEDAQGATLPWWGKAAVMMGALFGGAATALLLVFMGVL